MKQRFRNLSGGNQQKVLVAKWLLKDADIFIFHEPTRGIDIGPKSEMYELIEELTRSGKSVIMISSENTNDFVDKAYAWNVTDFIGRPFDASIVRRRAANTIALYAKHRRLEEMVEETFEGDLPAFIAAFSRSKKLSTRELEQLRRLIDSYEEG
jgi:ABC-type Mn2+/Zn2+ transport system ATPase subunit